MSVELRASVVVPAPIERVWATWIDAARFPQWQGAVIAVHELTGPLDVVGTTYVLEHGPKLQRSARVVAVEPPIRHVVEQTGVGVNDQAVATFERVDGGTLVTLVWYAHLNAVLRVLSRLDRKDRMQREAQDELERFATVVTRVPGPTRIGGRYLVVAGAEHRWLTVTGSDDGVVHVRLHPGHRRSTEPGDTLPPAPKPIGDQMDLWPIAAPIRAGVGATAHGLPFLIRDGGQGVAHLALSTVAWADAAGRDLAIDDPITDDDTAAVKAWRAEGGPVVGLDPTLALAPLCTLRLGMDDAGAEVWGLAKVLRGELLKVHVQVFGDRWPTRPTVIRPWEHRLQRMSMEAFTAGRPDLSVGVGHVPLERHAFSKASPRFAGVTTRTGAEVEPIAVWKAGGGGAFTTLQPLIAGWDGEAR